MSDADDQMGGEDERITEKLPPRQEDSDSGPGPRKNGSAEEGEPEPTTPDRESEQSFPASDPPGNY